MTLPLAGVRATPELVLGSRPLDYLLSCPSLRTAINCCVMPHDRSVTMWDATLYYSSMVRAHNRVVHSESPGQCSVAATPTARSPPSAWSTKPPLTATLPPGLKCYAAPNPTHRAGRRLKWMLQTPSQHPTKKMACGTGPASGYPRNPLPPRRGRDVNYFYLLVSTANAFGASAPNEGAV